MAVNKAPELQIPITAKDETKPTFAAVIAGINSLASSVSSGLGPLGAIAATTTSAVVALGAAATAAAVSVSNQGQAVLNDMRAYGDQLGLEIDEFQELYFDLQSNNPAFEMEKISESLKTLTEGFFDARAESGPLFDLMEDFGADIDLSLTDPREQLIEFLEVIQRLPDETDRVGAAISNLGEDDARAFIPIIRDLGRTEALLQQLRTTSENFPGILDDDDVRALDQYRASTARLAITYERFATSFAATTAPIRTAFADAANSAVTAMWAAGIEIGKSWDETSKAFSGIVERMFSIFEPYADFAYKKMQELGINIRDFFTSIASDIIKQFTDIKNAFTGFVEDNGFLSTIKGAIETATGAAKDIIGDTVGTRVVEFLNGDGGTAETILEALSDASERTFGEGVDVVSDFKDVASEIRKTFETASPISVIESYGETVKSLIETYREISASNPSLDPEVLEQNLADLRELAESEPELPRLDIDIDPVSKKLKDIKVGFASLASAMGTFASAASESNDKTIKDFQRLQIAMATISTWAGAADTLRDPRLGFYEKIGAFATIVATGFGAIQSIRSLNSSGSASSAVSTSTAESTALTALNNTQQNEQSESQPTRVTNVAIYGDGLYSATQIEQLLQAINDNDTGTLIRSDRIAA